MAVKLLLQRVNCGQRIKEIIYLLSCFETVTVHLSGQVFQQDNVIGERERVYEDVTLVKEDFDILGFTLTHLLSSSRYEDRYQSHVHMLSIELDQEVISLM